MRAVAPAETGEPIRKVRVESVDKIADAIVAISLVSLDGDALPDWQPGAHVDLLMTENLIRQYSLCGSPADRMRWRVAVLHTPDSRGGSAWLHTCVQPGDVLPVRGPRNNFRLAPARRCLFIAGGIGITPLLPMIEAARGQPDVDWQLAYGGRSRSSMAFVHELEQMGERVEIVSEDESGVLDLDRILGEPRIGVAIYACGPEGLLTELERRCRSWPPGTLHVERFRADAPTGGSAAGAETFQVVAQQSGVTVDVPPDRTIVEVLEERGIYVPVSCGEGVCGTCITRVIEGDPEHRDAVLAEDEQASGELITPCCSRSRTPRMTLDL
ncbi:PDR/VanB family oxidoreductase [Amycolatopsis ultiminotia]|uniref:PDR/VanB family oxidoreductase n=1 Tax=Amycolatopsis ultiminotia TaxID=543629 RepID=A0ABP6UYE1_9PSEU